MNLTYNFLTLYFNRGSFVTWAFQETGEGQTHVGQRFGIIECERSDRPGFYYVRDETGKLHSIKWDSLQLADRGAHTK